MEQSIDEMVNWQFDDEIEHRRWGEDRKQFQNIVSDGLNRIKADIVVFIKVWKAAFVGDGLLVAFLQSPNLDC
jgi:nicotinamide riboside kinase